MYVSLTSADKLIVSTTHENNFDGLVEVPEARSRQTRQVYCYKFSLSKSMAQRDIPRVNHLLYKMEGKRRRTVPTSRYYYQNGCLQMNGMKQRDNGKYMLLIKTCLSSRTVSVIYFTIKVVSSGNSTIVAILHTTMSCNNPHQYHLLLYLSSWFDYKYNVIC